MERLEPNQEAARCAMCRGAIELDTLAIRFRDRRSPDGVSAYHALCAALRRPTSVIVAIAQIEPSPEIDLLHAMANASRTDPPLALIWRRALRCLVELAGERYALFAMSGATPVVVTGTLDDVLASVPDADFESAVDAAVAAGKRPGRS